MRGAYELRHIFFKMKKKSAPAKSGECSSNLLIGIAIIFLYDELEEITINHITG